MIADEKQISKDWKWEKLEMVCSFVGGGTPSKKENSYWNGTIFWASVKDVKGDYLNSTEDKITEKGLKNSSANIAEPNEVILVTRIAPGKSIIANVKTAINQDLKIIKPKFETIPQFIHFFFKAFERELIKKSSGTTVLGLTLKGLNDIKIPVINLSTQQAIVSKIEELFSELDKGVEQLKNAQQQLKIYRQAVLKWAFEGKLTNENVKDGELPNGWKLTNLDVLGKLFCGQSSTVAEVNQKGLGTLYVTGPEQWNGKHIEQTKWTTNPRRIVPNGTIFITVKGAGVGKMFPGISCAIGRDVYAYLPSNTLNFKFTFYALKHSIDLVVAKAQGDIPGLAKNHILDHAIGICSIEEQIQTVQEIETRLSVADKLEESINQSLQQAGTLRQSILKRAFEGKLVATDTIETITPPAKVIPIERKVLAGKIIHLLHEDKHFGLTKFQKALYLVENFAQVHYETNFIQERAGPFDAEFTAAFRKEMQEKDWVQEEPKRSITRLVPGDNIGPLIKEYPSYFRAKGKDITFVLLQLKDKSTHDSELIATLYAVWNNRLIKKKPVKIDLLVEDFFNWSAKKKEAFQEEEIVSTYNWMKKVKLVPSGFGKPIEAQV